MAGPYRHFQANAACLHRLRPTQHEAERVKSLVSEDSSDSEVLELVQWGCLAGAGPGPVTIVTAEKETTSGNKHGLSWKIPCKWRFQ